jgi:hypothetical protein
MLYLEKQYVINCDDYQYVISDHDDQGENNVFSVHLEEWDVEKKEYVKLERYLNITLNSDEFELFKKVVNDFKFGENDD